MPVLSKDEIKGRIVIFTVTACLSCAKVKGLLNEIGVPFYEINLSIYPERRKEAFMRTGSRSVPQIFFNEKHIGGYQDLRQLVMSEELEEQLKKILEEEPSPDAPQPPPDEEPQAATVASKQTAGATATQAKTEKDCGCTDETCNIGLFDDDDDDIDLAPPTQQVTQISTSNESGATPISTSSEKTSKIDQYAELANEIKYTSKIVHTHGSFLKRYKNSFTGQALVNYLMKNKNFSKKDAITIGRQLLAHNFIHHSTHEHSFEDSPDILYCFLDESNKNCLNIAELSNAELKPSTVLAAAIRDAIVNLYAEFISDDGTNVDYVGMKSSPKFANYVSLAQELQRTEIYTLADNEKTAFFINIYNAMVIHAFVIHGAPTSLFKRYKFYNSASYMIGGLYFSLNDIESGILRANRKPVATFSVPFKKNDPRLEISLKNPEVRVHFALNCGAQSCPPIKTYSFERLNEELNIATYSFLEGGGVKIDTAKREIQPSKIFQWYKVDFGGSNEGVVDWISNNLENENLKKDLKMVMETPGYKVVYQSYNWDLNTKKKSSL